MQDLLTPHLTPHVLVQPHSSMGDTLACEIQVALNYTTFCRHFQSDTCLVCAHVCIGCDTVLMRIPQKEIVVESQKCDTIPQNIPFILYRAPEKENNVQVPTIDKHPIFVWYQIWVPGPLLLCAYFIQKAGSVLEIT